MLPSWHAKRDSSRAIENRFRRCAPQDDDERRGSAKPKSRSRDGPGTSISRLAVSKAPFRRMAIPGTTAKSERQRVAGRAPRAVGAARSAFVGAEAPTPGRSGGLLSVA